MLSCQPAARAILNRLHDDRAQWELVEVQPAVLDRAENLVFDVGVATLDALHIASALVFASEVGRRVSFITADAGQRAAATRVNLEVVWVG